MSTLGARSHALWPFTAPIIVAVPVNNEAERIGDCLQALAVQRDNARLEVLLLLNNCTDATPAVISALVPSANPRSRRERRTRAGAGQCRSRSPPCNASRC